MDRTIKDITDRMIRQLPGGRSRYPLEELHGMDFPSFLIDRISVELQRNLRATLDPPQTEWSRMDAEEVQVKWREFAEAAGKAACLPAGEMRAVIGRAVEECMKILVRPRHQIPSLLFGSAGDELPYGEVVQRLESTVVYTHFARLIPRYMQKKELRTLSRDRCEQIIAASDARMTENYEPSDWAALLQPLFELMDGTVDADLIRLFFEDKKMPAEAARFAAVDGTVNQPMLVRLLSASGEKKKAEASDWSRSLEERWPGDSRVTPDAEQAAQRESDPHAGGNEPAERVREPREKRESGPEGQNPPSGDPEPVSAVSGEQTGGDEPENIPIWMRFMSPEEREELRQAELEEAEAPESAPSEADLLFGIAETPPSKPEEKRSTAQEKPRSPSPSAGNGPRKEGGESGRRKREAAARPVSGKPGEKIAGTAPEPDHREELKALQRVMRDEREAFVSAVFGDSEEAYREALEDISRMEDWSSVSRYMQQNVFQQNLVEMYSEAAVEFTDRLQAFFLKKQHSN